MFVTFNGAPVDTRAPDLATLLQERCGGFPPGHAVARNGEVVCRDAVASTPLRAGDAVELVAAVAGG